MKKQHIFITGATGFIGKHVINRFIHDTEFTIVTIVREGSINTCDESLIRKMIVVAGDVRDPHILDEIFKTYSINYILHLAAIRGVGNRGNDEVMSTNVNATAQLLQLAQQHHIQKFVYCSSVGVYGTIPQRVPAQVKDLLNGDNAYHRSKIQAEQKVREYIQQGLNAYIVRPTITYGTGDRGFPELLVKLIRQRLFIVPQGDIFIHLLDVSSFAELMYTMFCNDKIESRIFNIADHHPVSLATLINMIHHRLYKKPYPAFLRLPNSIFNMLISLFTLCGNEKWVSRLQLISKSWHYDISDAVKNLNFKPVNTEDAFIETYFPSYDN